MNKTKYKLLNCYSLMFNVDGQAKTELIMGRLLP